MGETAICDRDAMLRALEKFTRQRPGMEFGNYGDAKSYRAELRGITRDFSEAQTLLRAVRYSGITADQLRDAFRAYSGRLSWDGERQRLEYCTGQYFPTEYRKAVCAVLASALWQHRRDGLKSGDQMRASFRREFGRGIASRWFN